MTRISVVIPTYRRPGSLVRCLEGIAHQSRPYDELLICLRDDDEESHEALAALSGRLSPPAISVQVKGGGQVSAINEALLQASGDILAITDDDVVPRPDWIERIERRFAEDPRLGAVGGRDIVHHGQVIEDGRSTVVGRVLWYGRAVGNHHLQGHLQQVHFLKGANMALRRESVWPFEERLRGPGAQVCNDMEATLSLHTRGWPVLYDPEIQVDHYPADRPAGDTRASTSLASVADSEHNELFTLLRWVPPWQKPVCLAYALLIGKRSAPGLIYAVWAVLRGEPPRRSLGRLVAATSGRLAALSTLVQWVRP